MTNKTADGSFTDTTGLLEILKLHYGLRGDSIKLARVNSWGDLCYVVKDGDEKKFIFKLYVDIFTSMTVAQIEAEIAVMLCLEKAGFVVPQVVMSRSLGKFYAEDSFDDDCDGLHKKRFRLQSYVDGRPAHQSMSVDNASKIGEMIGRVNATLANFSNPYFQKGSPHYLMEFVTDSTMQNLAYYLAEGRQKELAIKYLESYKSKVISNLEKLPKQQIQCDLHGSNLITDDAIALLDFSNSRRTLRIVEVAINLASILMFSDSPLLVCQKFLDGYESQVELESIEREVLPIVIVGRLIQALAIHSYIAGTLTPPKQDEVQKEAPYFNSIFKKPWLVIERLMDADSEEAKFFTVYSQHKNNEIK